jgi:hypothetical protein
MFIDALVHPAGATATTGVRAVHTPAGACVGGPVIVRSGVPEWENTICGVTVMAATVAITWAPPKKTGPWPAPVGGAGCVVVVVVVGAGVGEGVPGSAGRVIGGSEPA